MSGVPAGYEFDSDEDSDHEYHESDRSHDLDTYTPSESSIGNIGAVNQANLKDLEEQVSLNSESVRMAILKKNVPYLQKCLDNGFNTETLMQSGWTALMHAANDGSVDILKLLLERNARPNFQKELFTPLMAVCCSPVKNENNLVKCADLLINGGAKVNVHDRHVMTPLMYASKLGYAQLVDLLCQNNAQVNVQDSQGWTALTFAAANGFNNVARILLKHKIDHNLTTFDGQKPADIAFTNGFTILAEMLEKYDGDIDNLDQFQQIPDSNSSKSMVGTKYVKYGDLELFLHGLELGDLVPLLQHHHLEFTDLLKTTEEEMVEIGITQLGVRKKLIESIRDVHTNEWDMSSLSKDQMSKLATLEMAAIVANITKHLQFIHSSVTYINRHLHSKKDELISDNTKLQQALVDQSCEVFQVSNALHKDITVLRNDAINMFPNISQKDADFVESMNIGKRDYKKIYLSLGIIFVISGSIFAGYRILH